MLARIACGRFISGASAGTKSSPISCFNCRILALSLIYSPRHLL